MTRQQAAGRPAGAFGVPGSAAELLMAWAIPAVAAVAASAAGCLWLAGEISSLTSPSPAPGSPFGYVRDLARSRAPWPDIWGWLTLAVAAAVVTTVVVFAVRLVLARRGRRHRADEVAGYLAPRRDRQRLGERARAKESARLSPDAPAWAGSPLGLAIPGRQPVFSGPEDVSVDVWGARSGKTSKRVVRAILDAPGPVLATSNKRDVPDLTAAIRARRGRIWLFDPQAIASDGRPTFTFNPLDQVTNVSEAQKLASIFEASTREPGARTDAHWDTSGRDLLAWMFLAAAAHALPLGQVWDWLSNPDDAAPAALLREAGHDGPATAVQGVLGQPDKMRGSTFGTAQRMARSLVNPDLLAWVTPAPDLPHFTPSQFPASTDTLYALSKEGEGSGGPYVAALTAHACEAAERIAASGPTGRLGRPFIVELDEAANIVRWPELPKLYSHYGSRGILLHSYFQNWTQGVEAWGENGMRALWSAATIRVLGAGVADEKFLAEFSDLVGDHEEWIVQSVSTGRGERQVTRSLRKERTLAVSHLASLPKERAIVFTSGSRPVVIQTVPWQDGPHAAEIRAALVRAAALPIPIRAGRCITAKQSAAPPPQPMKEASPMMTPKRLARELEARLDGPHDDEHTAAAAELAAEAVRFLNYATGSHSPAALIYPATVYSIAADLSSATWRMQQLFTQLDGWLTAQDAAGMLGTDDGVPAADVVTTARSHLTSASIAAGSLSRHLDALHNSVSALNGRGPNRAGVTL